MAKIAFVTWAGGGNLPPALGIARALRARGHDVRFLGSRTQGEKIAGAQLAFEAFEHEPVAGASESRDERRRRVFGGIMMSSAIADDVVQSLRARPADVVVVDCFLWGVLARSRDFGARTAVLVHTIYAAMSAAWPEYVSMGAGFRAQAGLSPLDAADIDWLSKDLVLVTTLREFDAPSSALPAKLHYVGPIVERGAVVDAASRSRPRVLVSFSTMRELASPPLVQGALDALAELPVDVLVTTGEHIDTSALRVPNNAEVRSFVPHREVLPGAAVVVTHAGHGTVMASLAHGVPLVCIPGAVDQPIMASRVEACGVGRVVRGEDPSEIRDAVRDVLANEAYRTAARRMQATLANVNGADEAATLLESIVPVDSTTGDAVSFETP